MVWQNVRKMRSGRKMMELREWIKENENVGIFGASETGLIGDEFLDMEEVGCEVVMGQDVWDGKRAGGVSLVIRKSMGTYEIVVAEQNMVLVRMKKAVEKEWRMLVGVVYWVVEGQDPGTNEEMAKKLSKEVWRAKQAGMSVVIGGDYNAHTVEMDGHTNRNGKILRDFVEETEMEIVNNVFEEMRGATWARGEVEYCLDYVVADEMLLEKIREGRLLEWGDAVDSDHRGVEVVIDGWGGKSKPRRGLSRSKREGDIRLVDAGRVCERVEEMVGSLQEEDRVCELVVAVARGEVVRAQEDNEKRAVKGPWMDGVTREKIVKRRTACRQHRRGVKRWGARSPQVQGLWIAYREAKELASQAVRERLGEYNQRVVKEMQGEGGNERMWKHVRHLLKRTHGRGEDMGGVEMSAESMAETEGRVVGFWGGIFNFNGGASVNSEQGVQIEGLKELGSFSDCDMKDGLRRLKRGKAVGEDGVPGECLKELKHAGRKRLLDEFNKVLSGQRPIPGNWKTARVSLLHKGGNKADLANYRPVAIVSVECKLFASMIRNRLSEIVERSGVLGDLQAGFRKGHRTEDHLFVMERIMEVRRVQKLPLYLCFIDLEKAYDKVDRRKLFEVLRGHGGGEWVTMLEDMYHGNMVNFSWRGIHTDQVSNTSGVRQGCPLSPLLFNLYINAMATKLENHPAGILVEAKRERIMVKRRVAGLLYADDICLVAGTAVDMRRLMVEVDVVGKEYGLTFSRTKSKVVVIGEDECCDEEVCGGGFRLGDREIERCTRYKYLGVWVHGGRDGGFEPIDTRLKEVMRTVGMVKFAAARSGSRLIIGKEGWKGMVVPRLMYGGGALRWSAKEVAELERKQTEMMRYAWRVGKTVGPAVLRGETGYSSFEEREARAKLEMVTRVIEGRGLIGIVGSWSLAIVGKRRGWWQRAAYLARKYEVWELSRVIDLGTPTVRTLQAGGEMKTVERVRKTLKERTRTVGRRMWRRDLEVRGNVGASLGGKVKQVSETRKLYLKYRKRPEMAEDADGGPGARVMMMLRAGGLPVRAARCIEWRNEATECPCGEGEETVEHFLLRCSRLSGLRREYGDSVGGDGLSIERLYGYEGVRSQRKMARMFVGKMWRERERMERSDAGGEHQETVEGS